MRLEYNHSSLIRDLEQMPLHNLRKVGNNLMEGQSQSTAYDKLYKDAHYFNYKKWMFDPYVGALVKKFNIDKKALVLDIGCGTGFFSGILHSYNNMKVVGLDYSLVGLKTAKEKYGDSEIDFLLGDANALPFGGDTFDLIFCRALSIYGVDDLSNHTEISAHFLRRLKKGGVYIFAWSTDGSGQRNSQRRRLIGKQDTNWINHSLVDIREHFCSLESFGSIHFYFINRLDLLLFGRFGLNRIFTLLNRGLSTLTGIRGEAICVVKRSFW